MVKYWGSKRSVPAISLDEWELPASSGIAVPGFATLTNSEAKARRGPSALGSAIGILRHRPSESTTACTCPTAAAALEKRGNGSVHKLPSIELEILDGKTTLCASARAAARIESLASSSGSDRIISTPIALG